MQGKFGLYLLSNRWIWQVYIQINRQRTGKEKDIPHKESSQYDHHEELPQDSQYYPQFSPVYSKEEYSRSKEVEFLQMSVCSLSPSEGHPASKK